jgi:hypothetical protein
MNLYRYEDIVTGYIGSFPIIKVRLSEYYVTKETPKGYHIFSFPFRTWVSKTAKKRFAYPTKEEALMSFKLRKTRQISILKTHLDQAEQALIEGNKIQL